MSEEEKIKISQPMFEVGELERFDNNIHSIVEEYSKLLFKEKDQILTQRIIMKQEEEIERLHSIIKEVREFIEWHYEDNKKFYKNKGIGLNYPECDYILEILDKVGSVKE